MWEIFGKYSNYNFGSSIYTWKTFLIFDTFFKCFYVKKKVCENEEMKHSRNKKSVWELSKKFSGKRI